MYILKTFMHSTTKVLSRYSRASTHYRNVAASASAIRASASLIQQQCLRSYSSMHEFTPEYAFDMAASNVRVGRGVTKEIGQELLNMGIRDGVSVFTDKNLAKLPPVQKTLDSLTAAGIQYEVYDDVAVEPTDASIMSASDHCKRKNFKAFVAVGGGSVMDTCKAANLYMCNPDREFLDFVNAPIGKGMQSPVTLKPLICLPTTAGTGSETTGVAIFDHIPTGAKTGIRCKTIRPILGIIDPDHTKYCGPELTAFNGMDVLCHALESYTAVPFKERQSGAPVAGNPLYRPPFQGANPISDIWSGFALQQCAHYIRRAVEDNDPVAREQMCLASTAAGVGFGNAGVHLCHAMSYPISSRNKEIGWKPPVGYDGVTSSCIVPHGLSVVLGAPAVFRFTARADPEKHLRAAALMGVDIRNIKPEDAGLAISDALCSMLHQWESFVPNGLSGVGYTSADVPNLVSGAMPQRRIIEVAPRIPEKDDFHQLFEESMILF